MSHDLTTSLELPELHIPPFFKQWKSEQQSLKKTKRKARSELDRSLPNEAYYNLELDAIYKKIRFICSELVEALKEYEHATPELAALVQALNAACVVPRGMPCLVAFLGQQGIGKSTIINALLGRKLVSSSASSSACTSIPTYIYHKDNKPDNTKFSDVTVETLKPEHIEDSIALQITHYAEAYPYNRAYENREDEGDETSDEEHEEDDSEAALPDTAPEPSHSRLKKSSKKKYEDAATAKEFFDIIFDAKAEVHQREQAELDCLLECTDIMNGDDLRNGTFFQACLQKVEECRVKMAPLLQQMVDVHDDDLATIRKRAEKFWPLVHAMRITTGHRLLKHNIAFVDLPGYGDTNKIRNSLIDECRDQADFEVVVAPSIRMLTTTLQQTYLARSIKRRGEARTLLVTNKSDELVEDISKTMGEFQHQSPFTELLACFDSMDSDGGSRRNGGHRIDDDEESDEDSQEDESEDDTEDEKYRRLYAQRLLKLARLAEIRWEITTMREELQKRGINVPMLAISARQYQVCKERNPDPPPILDIDATGIPVLRQTMYKLPALNNLVTLRNHVYLTLPAIFDNIKHLMIKFTEDDGHAQLRETLIRTIPSLQASLTASLYALVHDHVLQPWGSSQQDASVLRSIEAELTFCNLHYQSFCKMLREDGKPRSGVALGYDLNQMIHRSMVDDLEKWKRNMTSITPGISQNLMQPVMDLVANMGNHFNQSSGDPDLKLAMRNAYSLMRQGMDQEYSALEAATKRNVNDTHFKFWSATSIYDPIVRHMRPIYRDTSLEYHRQPGRGVYARQKAHIRGLVLSPHSPDVPLHVKFANDLVSSQCATWKTSGEAFIASATARLQDFAQVMQNIVDVDFSETAEHETVVERLKTVLPGLESTLAELQNQIPKPVEKPRPGYNSKRARSTRSASSVPHWYSQSRLQTPQFKTESEAGSQVWRTEGSSRDVPIAIDCGVDEI